MTLIRYSLRSRSVSSHDSNSQTNRKKRRRNEVDNDDAVGLPDAKRTLKETAPNESVHFNSSSEVHDANHQDSQSNQRNELQPHLPEYRPSLGREDNPAYFEVNRILFEAHHMRVSRKSIGQINGE